MGSSRSGSTHGTRRSVVNKAPLVSPRLAGTVGDYYPSSVSVERAAVVSDPETGQPIETWAPVVGLSALPARVAPVVHTSVSAGETRTGELAWATNAWHISLPAYYPAILPTDRIAMDDGRRFNILGVEHDGNLQFTRLEAEEVV